MCIQTQFGEKKLQNRHPFERDFPPAVKTKSLNAMCIQTQFGGAREGT